MKEREEGLTLLELIVALVLTTVLALGAASLMITMQKSSAYTRSGGTLTQQAAFALQLIEKDLRNGVIEKNVACGTDAVFYSPEVLDPEVISATRTVYHAIKVKTPELKIVKYQCVKVPSTTLSGHTFLNHYKITRTEKGDAGDPGCAASSGETDKPVSSAVFSKCEFKIDGQNTIMVTLRGTRVNPAGVESPTREIVKTIYLTDFQET